MKFVHLSDLHIGKRVNEFSMVEDQRYILKEILVIVDQERPDGILIAGDVYDKQAPAAEAVQVFDWFLTELANREAPIFIISGNHDSAERLAFGRRLMEERKVYLAPVYDGSVKPVELRDEYGSVYIYMLPFVKPHTVRRCFPQEEIESFDDGVRCAVRHITGRPGAGTEEPDADAGCVRCPQTGACRDTPGLPETAALFDASARNILIAHQFVTGASCCESEELSIGGLDQVSADIFDPFDYVALGHIHGPQRIGRETVRYCGTPLKYSFSEAGHKKSVTVTELFEKGNVSVTVRPLTPIHDMREIRGTYEEVTRRGYYQGAAVDDYLHITLTDEEDVLDAMGKLRSIYPNIMKLDYDNQRTRAGGALAPAREENKSPLDLLGELYQLQNNQNMTQLQQGFAAYLMEEIWEGKG